MKIFTIHYSRIKQYKAKLSQVLSSSHLLSPTLYDANELLHLFIGSKELLRNIQSPPYFARSERTFYRILVQGRIFILTYSILFKDYLKYSSCIQLLLEHSGLLPNSPDSFRLFRTLLQPSRIFSEPPPTLRAPVSLKLAIHDIRQWLTLVESQLIVILYQLNICYRVCYRERGNGYDCLV